MIFFCFSFAVSSEIIIENRQLESTEGTFLVPVVASNIDISGKESVISLEYDKRVLFLENIITEGYAFSNGKLSFDTGDNLQSLTAASDGLFDNDTLFILEMRFLLGSAREAVISTESFQLEGSDIEFEDGTATISYTGDLIIGLRPDTDMSPLYPNPFAGRLTIPFSIAGNQQVAFHFYNSLGEKVASLPNTSQAATADAFNSFDLLYQGSIVDNWSESEPLSEGAYSLSITPNLNKLTSGRYTVYMIAGDKVIVQGAVLLK